MRFGKEGTIDMLVVNDFDIDIDDSQEFDAQEEIQKRIRKEQELTLLESSNIRLQEIANDLSENGAVSKLPREEHIPTGEQTNAPLEKDHVPVLDIIKYFKKKKISTVLENESFGEHYEPSLSVDRSEHVPGMSSAGLSNGDKSKDKISFLLQQSNSFSSFSYCKERLKKIPRAISKLARNEQIQTGENTNASLEKDDVPGTSSAGLPSGDKSKDKIRLGISQKNNSSPTKGLSAPSSKTKQPQSLLKPAPNEQNRTGENTNASLEKDNVIGMLLASISNELGGNEQFPTCENVNAPLEKDISAAVACHDSISPMKEQADIFFNFICDSISQKSFSFSINSPILQELPHVWS